MCVEYSSEAALLAYSGYLTSSFYYAGPPPPRLPGQNLGAPGPASTTQSELSQETSAGPDNVEKHIAALKRQVLTLLDPDARHPHYATLSSQAGSFQVGCHEMKLSVSMHLNSPRQLSSEMLENEASVCMHLKFQGMPDFYDGVLV